MDFVIKKMFHFDETFVLAADLQVVAKLISNSCYQVYFGLSWLLKFAAPLLLLASLKLSIRSMVILPRSITGLKIFSGDSVRA